MTGAPYIPGSDTSEEAAEAIEPRLSLLQELVLVVLRHRPNGLTDEEMQTEAVMQPSTQRPRRVELVAQGLVEDSGTRRKTRSGRSAVVWKVVRT